MRIEHGIALAYATGQNRQRTATEDPAYHGQDGRAASAGAHSPAVAPAIPSSYGFANALWLAGPGKEESVAASEALAAEFMELSKLTPAELIRKEMLEARNLTEESLKTLSEEERAAIEEEIRRAIEARLGIGELTQADGETATQTAEA